MIYSFDLFTLSGVKMSTAESIHIAVALMMQRVSCFNALISKKHTSLTSTGVIVILARKKRHNHKNKIVCFRGGGMLLTLLHVFERKPG